MVRLRLAFLGLVASLATVACSGGGASAPGAPRANPLPNAGNAKIFVPSGRLASGRGARFVAASVVSVATSTNGGPAVITDISATSAACTAAAGGRSCSVPLSALPGLATFTFSLYDAAAGAGKLLGSGTATFTVVAGTPFVVPVTLNGVVSSVSVTLPTAFNAGVASSLPVIVTAKDPDGNTIIAPGNYTTPIALTNSDTTGTFKLSAATVNGPSDAIVLTYNGGNVSAPVTIAPVLAGLPATALVPATVSAQNYTPSTVSYTQNSTVTTVTTFINQSPAPAPTTTSLSTVDRHVLTPGATYGGVSNAIDDRDTYTYNGQLTTIDSYAALIPSGSSSIYTSLGSTYSFTNTSGTFSFTSHENIGYVAIPFVDGATLTADRTFTETSTYSPAPAPSPTGSATPQPSYGFSQTSSSDAAGNRTSSSNSTFLTDVQKDNADGSGSRAITLTPPIGNLSGISATVTAPSGGTVAVSITQTFTNASPQVTNLTAQTSVIYPYGVPPNTQTFVDTVSTAAATLPAECPVPAVLITGPLITVSGVRSYWSPTSASAQFRTEKVYLAPGLGVVCNVGDTKSSDYVDLASFSSTAPTLASLTAFASTSTSHSVSYTTALGVASIGRSIYHNGYAYPLTGLRMMRPDVNPFARTALPNAAHPEIAR